MQPKFTQLLCSLRNNPGNKNKKSSDLMVYHTITEGSMDQMHFLKTVSNIFQLKHAFINQAMIFV